MQKDSQTERQEAEYHVPYHHLTNLRVFHNAAVMHSGIEYFGYMRAVIAQISRMPYERLLDVGCGDGKMLLELATLFPEKTHVGVDMSLRAILFARAMSTGNTNVFECDSVENIPGRFDIVTLIETLEHIPDEELSQFVAHIADRVVPGGKLLITVPTTNFPTHKKHYRHYTKELLASQLSPHFEIIETSYWVRESLLYKLLVRVTAKFSLFACIRRWSAFLAERFVFRADAGTGRHVLAVCVKK